MCWGVGMSLVCECACAGVWACLLCVSVHVLGCERVSVCECVCVSVHQCVCAGCGDLCALPGAASEAGVSLKQTFE